MAKKSKASTGGLFTEETKPIPAKEVELSPIPAKVEKVLGMPERMPSIGELKAAQPKTYTDYGTLLEDQRQILFPNRPMSLKELKANKNNRK